MDSEERKGFWLGFFSWLNHLTDDFSKPKTLAVLLVGLGLLLGVFGIQDVAEAVAKVFATINAKLAGL